MFFGEMKLTAIRPFELRITSCPVHLTEADSYEDTFFYKIPIQLVKLGPYHFVH